MPGTGNYAHLLMAKDISKNGPSLRTSQKPSRRYQPTTQLSLNALQAIWVLLQERALPCIHWNIVKSKLRP
jgi:hypothetical protein